MIAELVWCSPGHPSSLFHRELFNRELFQNSWKSLMCGKLQRSSQSLIFPRPPCSSKVLVPARSQRPSNAPGPWIPFGITRSLGKYRRRSLPTKFLSQGPRGWASLRHSSLGQHPSLDLSLILCRGQSLSPCLALYPN